MIGKQVFYEGRVQGVGFRYSVKQIAHGFEVRGWVRNLSDGRVELCAVGDSEEVDAFLTGVRESHLNGNIKSETASKIDAPVSVRGFEIR